MDIGMLFACWECLRLLFTLEIHSQCRFTNMRISLRIGQIVSCMQFTTFFVNSWFFLPLFPILIAMVLSKSKICITFKIHSKYHNFHHLKFCYAIANFLSFSVVQIELSDEYVNQRLYRDVRLGAAELLCFVKFLVTSVRFQCFKLCARFFFISNTFISNARVKLAKSQANANQ